MVKSYLVVYEGAEWRALGPPRVTCHIISIQINNLIFKIIYIVYIILYRSVWTCHSNPRLGLICSSKFSYYGSTTIRLLTKLRKVFFKAQRGGGKGRANTDLPCARLRYSRFSIYIWPSCPTPEPEVASPIAIPSLL